MCVSIWSDQHAPLSITTLVTASDIHLPKCACMPGYNRFTKNNKTRKRGTRWKQIHPPIHLT